MKKKKEFGNIKNKKKKRAVKYEEHKKMLANVRDKIKRVGKHDPPP